MNVPQLNMNQARFIAGGGSFALVIIVLIMLAVYPDLRDDDLFKILAQAIVIQGLIGLVMPFLFTGSNDTASGRTGDPVHIEEEE